jgi:tRNA uridine 5-carbamoylmethylation protein Kti12
MRKTQIIALLAGPGAGKSTLAYHLMSAYKERGASVEYVDEYAKFLTWRERLECLKCQPHVLGEQFYRLQGLVGKVDFIVTDSPILLSACYAKEWPKSLRQLAVDLHKMLPCVNYFVKRTKKYIGEGRNQSEKEARAIDEEVIGLLIRNKIPYDEIFSTKVAATQIIKEVGNG